MSAEDSPPDYIIVGAGSAVAALAYRLTEDPRTTVLLVEAGNRHTLRAHAGELRAFHRPCGVNWRYRSEPEAGTANRAIPVPRGKMLGGSSSLNGLVYVRGQTLDYDTWAQRGNRGWGWDDVAKIFRRMEGYENGDGEVRGTDGPLGITEVPGHIPLYDGLFAAADSIGLRRNPDYNGPDQEGIGQVSGDDQGRPTDEYGRMLPSPRDAASQSAGSDRSNDAAPAVGRQAVSRHRLSKKATKSSRRAAAAK